MSKRTGFSRAVQTITVLDGLLLIAVGAFTVEGYGVLPVNFWRLLYAVAGIGLISTLRQSDYRRRAVVAGLVALCITPHAIQVGLNSWAADSVGGILVAIIWLLYMGHITVRLGYWSLLEGPGTE